MNAREDEPGGDRLAVWTVAEGDGLGAVGSPSRAISSPIGSGLAVRARSAGSRAPSFFLRGGTANMVPCSNTFVSGPTDSTYSHPASIKAIAQPGVLAIGVIAEHRRLGHFPARGALDQLDPELRLGLESNLARGSSPCAGARGSAHQSSGRYSAHPNGTVPRRRPRAPTPRSDSYPACPASPSTGA